jgi:hypothetical protein
VSETTEVKADQESRQVWIDPLLLSPSIENTQLYADTEESLNAFAEHIRRDGVLEPLVITADNYVVSGHRRRSAAVRAGLKAVPCRQLPKKKSEFGRDQYIALLREFNRQRSKTIDEIIRETLVDANPEVAYTALVQSRERKARNGIGVFEIIGEKHRAEISDAKRPMLEAVKKVIEDRKEFWPLTDRGVHYPLLNDPPLRHAKKPDSTYRNNRNCYQDLCDLLTRARIAGEISFDAIADPTRPMKVWKTHKHVGDFIKSELDDLFSEYWRDILQSQPDHHEIVVEKNTALAVVEGIARKYTISITSGRGQCCKDRLYKLKRRFRQSKKDRLVLYILTDFDPGGDAISNATARSLRDDFGIPESRIVPVRVALRLDQVESFALPRSLELKEDDENRKSFVARHGVDFAVELEAMEPADLQAELDKQIRAHIDVGLLNKEVELEKAEAGKLQAIKASVLEFMKSRRNVA